MPSWDRIAIKILLNASWDKKIIILCGREPDLKWSEQKLLKSKKLNKKWVQLLKSRRNGLGMIMMALRQEGVVNKRNKALWEKCK